MPGPMHAGPMVHARRSPSSDAAPLGNLAILIVGHVFTTLATVPHLVDALQKHASLVDVHLCMAETTTMPPLAGTNVTSVLRFRSGFDQFQRAHACYTHLANASHSRSYDWFLRTRPDVNYMPTGQVHALDASCVHTKLREVKNLAGITKHVLSYDQCSGVCPGWDVPPADRACLDVDDQLSMVPAQLAPAFFGFGAYDFAHSRYSSLGDCRGFDGAENRLTQWLLHQKLRVCVIGHNSSGFDVRYYLHKIPYPVGSPMGSSASPNAVVGLCERRKRCGPSLLDHSTWMARVLAYPVKVCPHPKPIRPPPQWRRADECCTPRGTGVSGGTPC